MNNQPHNIISFNSVCINLLTNEIFFLSFGLKKSIFDQSNLLEDNLETIMLLIKVWINFSPLLGDTWILHMLV
jgi:hypothetical protein